MTRYEDRWKRDLEPARVNDPDGVWFKSQTAGVTTRIRLRIQEDSRTLDRAAAVIDLVIVESADRLPSPGLAGTIRIPHRSAKDGARHTVNLASARREASRIIYEDQIRLRERNRDAWDRAQRGEALTTRDNQLSMILAMKDQFLGFTEATTRPSAGRPRTPLLVLAIVAHAYETALTVGPTDIQRTVWDLLHDGGLDYAYESIRSLISRSRKAGMLTTTTPGRGGGEATPKAQNLIHEAGIEFPTSWQRPPNKPPR
jgi:hypothetical protein